jgi:competence CoiA-like predicted nuclease
MLSACNRHGEVQAAEVEPQDGPFFCCACRGPVILKQGHIKIPHFAHPPDAHCIYTSVGESEEHQRTKLEIYQALLRTPGVTDVRLERYLEEVDPMSVLYCVGSRSPSRYNSAYEHATRLSGGRMSTPRRM